ncbi:hypothetical protein ACFE04_031046 [Oxalis oulophora]
MEIVDCSPPPPPPQLPRHHLPSSFTSLRFELQVIPIVKYSALSIFAQRFLPSLSSVFSFPLFCCNDGSNLFYMTRIIQRDGSRNWLLHPIRESSLQLFVLVSLWISSKIHESVPLRLSTLKSYGGKFIEEDHFTTGDYSEAEVVLLQILKFEIGTTSVAFRFLEDLFVRLKAMATVGKNVNFEACMDIMDLLYEKEETSILYTSPTALAASVSAYVITVPKQSWEFPILPWGKIFFSDSP